jgi:hypothetical protein
MEKEIKELYENGFNYKEIGKKLGKDQRTIKKIVINNGYQQLLKIRRCKYDLNENFLNHIGDNQLWFLGLMSSDGYIINENRFGISQSGENGEKIIKYLKEILEYNGPIYFGKTIGKDKHSLIITSNKLVKRYHSVAKDKSPLYESASQMILIRKYENRLNPRKYKQIKDWYFVRSYYFNKKYLKLFFKLTYFILRYGLRKEILLTGINRFKHDQIIKSAS